MPLSPQKTSAAYGLARDFALAEVSVAFAAREIDFLVIKGPVIADWLYDDRSERPYGDVDLLVSPAEFEAAEATLADLGYEYTGARRATFEQLWHEHEWRRGGSTPALFDLHRALHLIPAPPPDAWALLRADASRMTIAGESVEIPCPAAHLVIIALHAAQHGAKVPKPLEDLRRAIERATAEDWEAAGSLAARLGAAGSMREALGLVEHGTELADRLSLASGAARNARLMAQTPPKTALGIEVLVNTQGVRARSYLLIRKLLPTRAFMRSWQPLARRGRGGLALAYIWRPLWLMANLPRGTLAWATTEFGPGVGKRLTGFLRGSRWAVCAWLRCRFQLRRGGLELVSLQSPPSSAPGLTAGAKFTLAHLPTSCLERSLVRQRWHAARGNPRDLVIGVRGPASAMAAHAWLEGDQPHPAGFSELRRWPTPKRYV